MNLSRINLDNLSIQLTKLTVFFAPFMFFNSMRINSYGLQITELFSVPMIFLFLIRYLRTKEKENLKFTFISVSIICFIFALIFSFINSSNQFLSYIAIQKYIYLFLLAITICKNAIHFNISKSLLKCLAYSYLSVFLGAIIGAVLASFGIKTFLGYPSRIISVALGIQNYLPILPRVSSVLSPTANLTAAYFSILFLPALDYLFSKKLDNKPSKINFIFIIFLIFIGSLTMSRAFLGMLFGFSFGMYYLNWKLPKNILLIKAIFFGSLILFILLQIYTIFYPIDFNIQYFNDPSYTREIVDLGYKKILNPVYFLRDGIGLEKISINFDFAYNHYAWLKFSSLKILQNYPLFGVGIGAFSEGVKDLVQQGIVNKELVYYVGAQSQFFTIAAETGILGIFSFIFMIFAITRRFFIDFKNNIYSTKSFFFTIPLVFIIALDVDLLYFRWLWIVVGIFLSISFESNSKKEIIT